MLLEHTAGDVCADKPRNEGCHEHARICRRLERRKVVGSHALPGDLRHERIMEDPQGQRASAHAEPKYGVGEGVAREALVARRSADDLGNRARGEHKPDDEGREHPGDEVDERGNHADDEDRPELWHLRAGEHERDAGEQGVDGGHEHPKVGMQAAEQHEEEVDDEVERGEDADGDEVASFKAAGGGRGFWHSTLLC